MRSTLNLDNDAVKSIRCHAKRRHVSLSKAASELIRRGASYQIGFRKVDGLPVLDVPEDFPAITTERVRELLAEE